MQDQKPSSEDERNEDPKRRENQEAPMPESLDRDSNRTESDGEDFNPGGRPRARTEATGEDF